LSAESNSLNLAINQLTLVANGTVASVPFGSINGVSVAISATDLANSDRALIGLIQAIATPPTSSAQSAVQRTPKAKPQAAATTSVIQQDAQNLYTVSTSVGATQGQISASVAQWVNDAGDTTDPNFQSTLLKVAGFGFAVGLVVNPVTAGPTLVALVGEPALLTFYLEAAPDIIADIVMAAPDGGLGIANAFAKELSIYIGGENAGVAYELTGVALETWNLIVEKLCGSETNCFSFAPLPPALPSLLTSVTLGPYGSTSPGSSTMTTLGGTSATGVLTFSGPVPTGGVTVSLSSSNAAARLSSSSILVSAGQTSVTFTITTSAVSVQTVANISAAAASVPQTATLTLTAPASPPPPPPPPPTPDAVTPGTESVGSAGTCSGGTLTASFQVNAASNISWTASGDTPAVGGATMRVSGSGKGSGAISVTITVPPQLPSSSYSSCSLTYKLNTLDNVYVTFSDGTVIGATAYWTFIGVT
jgi:hypothetical protein